MSTPELQTVIRNSQEYKSGDAFPPSSLCSNLGDLPVAGVCEILQDMVEGGELVREGRKYRRARTTVDWLRRPWRRRTDDQLGLPA